jgi:hypothetical protein
VEQFATWLKDARRNAAVSQEKLAADARELDPNSAIYQGRITDWETAKDLPSLRQFGVLAAVLHLSRGECWRGLIFLRRAAWLGLPVPDLHETSEDSEPDNASPLVEERTPAPAGGVL